MSDLENKKIFLIASSNSQEISKLEQHIKARISHATVFSAVDGIEALFKSENVPPHVVLIDSNVQKIQALDLVDKFLRRKDRVAVVVVSDRLDKEHLVDEVVTGQVQFVERPVKESQLGQALTRALNWVADGENSNYRLRFLAANEVLIQHGEKGDYVYLVKSGKLKAYREDNGQHVVLGQIQPGEFVGEMSYINNEARSASVMSLTDCELIEIPSKSLDVLLFSRPAWSKALVKTLSQRLKNSNEEKTQKAAEEN
ncbi:cyclic nucleotide-binding domain-containing protein [Bdellovibrio sp. 22V]|uniref:cyclic nucleotide-binding domain-containing protein n=1 Tax=Bdellovibrio sp. 22V TaxID=3044166 RepID=UPI0025436DBE|nr:cyclic nucleotide-binding domain-containing protein [Bdellovibrio sp. 22V]WII72531.1 cyclic nucleotide-binding domain-containing protein [Bdellovibrio sp. 22V]